MIALLVSLALSSGVATHVAGLIPLASDGNGGELALLLAGPAGGAAIYAAVYRYYRNADKTHQFERETLIALKNPITGQDQKVDEIRGTRESHIRGDNSRNFRQRVAKLE